MYCNEFARAARENPSLEDMLARLEPIVTATTRAGPFRVEDLAAYLAADANQVRSALDALCALGVLERQDARECRSCETLILLARGAKDVDPAECSNCGHPTPGARCLVVYRRVEVDVGENAVDGDNARQLLQPPIDSMKTAGLVPCRQSDETPFLYECTALGDITLREIQSRLNTRGLCLVRMAGQTPEQELLHSLAKHFGKPSPKQNDFL